MWCKISMTPQPRPLIYIDEDVVSLFHILIVRPPQIKSMLIYVFFLIFFVPLWHILDLMSLEGTEYPQIFSSLPNKQMCKMHHEKW